jgi:ABC-type antimicrobial peptide transport system permease subunit
MVDVPSVSIERLDALVGASQQDLRTTLVLLGGFAGLGFLVAGLGVYTSVTLLVASKTRDLGVRVALGATRRSVRLLLIRHVARLLAALPLGWALGWGIARLLSHLLFGVTATDPATYVISTIAVIIAVGVAAVVPVFRAGATAPAVVLRSD